MAVKKASIVKSSLNILAVIGENLRELRISKGYKVREQFAADFDLPRVQYWRIEKGMANITFKSLAKILAIHGLTIEEFFLVMQEKKNQKKNAGALNVNGDELRMRS